MLSLFAPEKPLDIYGPNDYGKIPAGFFRILLSNKKEKLGYKPPSIVVEERDDEGRKTGEHEVASPFGLLFDVKSVFSLGGQTIALDKPLRKLPLVRLNFFGASSAGIARVGGTLVVNTEQVRQPDGFAFDTSDPAGPRDEVDYV